ncbi:MAG: hypothetical protein Q9195_008040 [Heterodermia aff. obscurata]
MAEALVAVGVGASILQFVTVTGKLIQRINEFSSTAEEMPKALRDIHLQLPFLVETCEKLDTGSESANVSAIINACHEEIEDLYKMLDKIHSGPEDRKLRRAFKAFNSIRYQDRFDLALRKIEKLKTNLILHSCQERSQAPNGRSTAQRITHNLRSAPLTPSIPRRKLLREIHQQFNEYEYESSGHKIVVLLGMGGQGKSWLALEFGREVITESPNKLVLWLDATSKRTLTRSLEDVADRWNNRKRKFADINSRMEYIRDVLSEREWLLVFDNYDHPDQFPDVCTFIPPGNGSILITSRHEDAAMLGKTVRLSGMDEREGLDLLRRRTEQNLSDPAIREEGIKILHTLGHLPLAIDQAAAYIRQQRLPLHQFLQIYESQKETVLSQKHVYWDYKKKLHGEEREETPLGVLTTWELSIQQVSGARSHQCAVEHLLTIAAFLGQIEVSESLFREYAHRIRPVPEWLGRFTTKGQWDPHAYRDVVSELLRLSLVQGSSSTTGECCLSLHPMIKDWLQLRISDADRSGYIMEAINILANFIDANVQERSLQEARGLLGHLDACIHSHRKFPTAHGRLGFGHLRGYAITFSSFYLSHGRYREAEEGFQEVLDHDEQNYGKNHGHTFQTMRHLAEAFLHGGKYNEARDLLSKALHESQKKPDVETLHILSGLAGVYAKQDRPADAERYYETALKAHAVRKEFSKPHEVYPLYERLAEVKRYLGKHDEAEDLYKQAHRGYEQSCSYDEDATLDMLRTAGGLADLLRMNGRYGEAEISYREAWEGYKRYLGSDHPKTIVMLTNLAISCRNQENFEEAENYLEECAMVLRKSLGPDHPDSLRAMMNWTICIDKQGRYEEAETKYREVLKGREKKLGLSHPYTQRTIERLAYMLWMQGQHDKAEDLVRRILTKEGKLSVEYQPRSTNCTKFPALETLYTEALQRCKSKMSYHHVDALETCECLRLVYVEQGEHGKAKELADHIANSKSKTKLDCEKQLQGEKEKNFSPTSQEHKLEGAANPSSLSKESGMLEQTQNKTLSKRAQYLIRTKSGFLLLLPLLLWYIWSRWPL